MPAAVDSANSVATTTQVVCVDIVVSDPTVNAARQVHRGWQTISNFILVCIVFAGLLVPAFGYFTRPPAPLDDNRDPAPLPPLSWKKYAIQDFPKWSEMHVNDHLGYRDHFLRWHRVATNKLFSESSSPKAWIGREGWIYLNVDDPNRNDPDKPSLAARIDHWAEVLAARHAYLQDRGIAYCVVIAPEKSSIYPEYLPLRRQRMPPPEPSQRLVEKLASRGVPVVDTLPALRSARAQSAQPLFYRTDSHWTPDGAHVAYRAIEPILKQVLPGWQALPDADYDVLPDAGGGDLWRFVAPVETFTREPSRCFVPRQRTTRETVPEYEARLEPRDRQPHIPLRTYSTPTATGPRLLLLRDSFATAMIPFFSADFQQVTAIPTHRLPLVAIEEEKPQIVIQQIVARFLYSEVPENPPEIRSRESIRQR